MEDVFYNLFDVFYIMEDVFYNLFDVFYIMEDVFYNLFDVFYIMEDVFYNLFDVFYIMEDEKSRRDGISVTKTAAAPSKIPKGCHFGSRFCYQSRIPSGFRGRGVVFVTEIASLRDFLCLWVTVETSRTLIALLQFVSCFILLFPNRH
jgi:hypothetical protein